MAETFYNPYHFVPVAKRDVAQRHDLERDEVGKGAVTHDRYVAGTHSGEMVCRLTTVTPIVLGSTQTRRGTEVGHVAPYMRDGKPAIPGSSLRGMVSSMVEAASNSALRVLAPTYYSYRKSFQPKDKETLSAIGIIVDDRGTLKLKPMVLPTLNAELDPWGRPTGRFEVPQRFRRIFVRPAFKVYVGDKNAIRSSKFPHRTLDIDGKGIRQLAYTGNFISDHPSLHCKPNEQDRKFLVAQKPEDEVPLRGGFYRVLGCWGDRSGDQIPSGKKHELWLPAPGKDVAPIAIDPVAIERFHVLADERTEASIKARQPVMPFHPLDTPRNLDPDKCGKRFRLKAKDLVYFEVNEQSVVIEMALAAIWRGRVEDKSGKAAGAHDFFAAVDPDLVPFQPGRTRITIAEQMFGFVEEDFHKPIQEGCGGAGQTHPRPSESEGSLALASRIRFTDAAVADQTLKCDQILEPELVTLRILSSPKPPSPALYFKPRTGLAQWIGKSKLKPEKDDPQGRKVYLHQRGAKGERPWETGDPGSQKEQKNSVQPVRAGIPFEFRVRYDNLTDDEMGLLLYGLAPDPGFHHKLGMGKPLGLGSIKIEVLRVEKVDRARRYTFNGLKEARSVSCEPPVALREALFTRGLISRKIHRAISVLGDFAHAPEARLVHPPMVEGQLSAEGETFKWFVANDGILKEGDEEIREQRACLKALGEGAGGLTVLPTFEWQQSRRRQ